MPALARNFDSILSQETAEEFQTCDRIASQRHLCLMQVWKTPGYTAAEIARSAGLKRHVPSRRLAALRQSGQVKNGPHRICVITGNLSMTWFPSVENN